MISRPDAFLLAEGRVVEEGDIERLTQLEGLVMRGFARKKLRGKLYCRMPSDADQAELLYPDCEGYAIADPDDDDVLHYCSICERPLSPAKKRAVQYYSVWPNREAIASELVAGLGREGFAFRELAPGVLQAETSTGPVYVVLVAYAKEGAAFDPDGAMRKRAVYLVSSVSEETRVPPGSEWCPLLDALDGVGSMAHYLRALARLVPPWSIAPHAALPKLDRHATPPPRSDPTMSNRVFHGLRGRAHPPNMRTADPAGAAKIATDAPSKLVVQEVPAIKAPLLGVPPADLLRVLAEVVTHEGHRELRMEDVRLLRERAKEFRLFIDAHGGTVRDEAGGVSHVEVTRAQLFLLGEMAKCKVPLAPSELQFARDQGLFDAERLLERVRARIDVKKGRYAWTLLHTERGSPKRYLWRPPPSFTFAIILPRE